MKKYILIGREILECNDTLAWGRWFETADRPVAKDELAPGIVVSTVFIGLDMGFYDTGIPILFETMTFTDYEDGERCYRYATWDEAEAGHKEEVARMQALMDGRVTQNNDCVK
jgi:hypothetical protein